MTVGEGGLEDEQVGVSQGGSIVEKEPKGGNGPDGAVAGVEHVSLRSCGGTIGDIGCDFHGCSQVSNKEVVEAFTSACNPRTCESYSCHADSPLGEPVCK